MRCRAQRGHRRQGGLASVRSSVSVMSSVPIGSSVRIGSSATVAAVGASDSTTSATALTLSSSRMFITRTPVAARPCWLIPRTAVRWTMPSWEMNTSSWCSRTTSAPPSAPLASVSLIVMTPLAPRDVLRYWSIRVRLP